MKRKQLLLLILLCFVSSAFAQNVQVTERLSSKMKSFNPLQYTRVLILERPC
ncbi:MAG: hypothetical protein IPG99_11850 [Ignavibacteria bacterium]|nr:hypothetical protein [Ignavibacteria bacterium]